MQWVKPPITSIKWPLRLISHKLDKNAPFLSKFNAFYLLRFGFIALGSDGILFVLFFKSQCNAFNAENNSSIWCIVNSSFSFTGNAIERTVRISMIRNLKGKNGKQFHLKWSNQFKLIFFHNTILFNESSQFNAKGFSSFYSNIKYLCVCVLSLIVCSAHKMHFIPLFFK